MKSLAVYCGSRGGNRAIYAEKTAELGKLMAEKNIELIFGGGSVGLMNVVAESVLAHGGVATGVIPHFLDAHEVGHKNLTNMHRVETFPERKTMMIDLSDAFVALPGGYGTLEEITEVLTISILGDMQGIRRRPCGFLNVEGFYDAFEAQLDRMVEDDFLHISYRKNAIFAKEPAELLEKMMKWSLDTYDKFDGDIFVK
ncbi:MAG: hypothetical protein RL757_2155 [Bacteroidota bacterium]